MEQEFGRKIVPEISVAEKIDTEVSSERQSSVFESKKAEDDMYPSAEELASAKHKITIRGVIQTLILLLTIGVLIFIINFIGEYWQILLIVTGLLLILAIMLVWFIRKRN